MTTDRYFSSLLSQVALRSRQSVLSRLGFANRALHRHLNSLFAAGPGEPGAFLADPSVEAVFGWQPGTQTLAELGGGLLHPDTIAALDQPAPELREQYRFDKQQKPYRHQLESWQLLAQEPARSVVVASGTGSGKTECFMVPILDQLARERLATGNRRPLSGVRALFLYPLNALINSQRDRLRAWTHRFDGDIRFCLYNGNTPKESPAHLQREQPSEVMDRRGLRARPPSILVTNATMLEYMLVRAEDQPILDQSKGQLQWIVLDEAHSYIGSQAAEIALLLRRVMAAFAVDPEQVRFVATSATIGDPKGAAGKDLQRFLANLSGVDSSRVEVIAGQRLIPALAGDPDPGNSDTLELLASIDAGQSDSEARYNRLVTHPVARRIRAQLTADPARSVARLSELAPITGSTGTLLHWLDLLSGTRHPNGEPFLPLRAHLFHRTLSGLWACADPGCTVKQGSALDDPDWPFGQVYLDPRQHCSCSAPVYEVVKCSDCATVYLQAEVLGDRLIQVRPGAVADEFELDADQDEDELEEGGGEVVEADPDGLSVRSWCLISNRPGPEVEPVPVDRDTLAFGVAGERSLTLACREAIGQSDLCCPACDARGRHGYSPFRESRIGAPFLLGILLPALLEFAPDGPQPVDNPCRGRRLLGFNDSRQGTARIAVRLQQEAERNRVRGLIYHLVLRDSESGRDSAALRQNRDMLAAIETVPREARTPELVNTIARLKQTIAAAEQPQPVGFDALARELAGQSRDIGWMRAAYRRYAPDPFDQADGAIELAKLFLIREFGRRPRVMNNLETMGLVATTYPGLGAIDQVPASVVEHTRFQLQEWRDFLTICLDHFVRSGGSLVIPNHWRRWLGVRYPQTRLVPADTAEAGRYQRRWPQVARSGASSLLVRLLARVLDLDIHNRTDADRIDTILLEAWRALVRQQLLVQDADGRVLAPAALAFVPIRQAWICPFTRRVLDTTLRGVTPYLPRQTTREAATCKAIGIPRYDVPFGGVEDDLERVRRARDWLAAEPGLAPLREQALWTSLNDRVVELTPFFTVAEHSAQIEAATLQRYESDFKAGRLNLLSCSTTMEMGIDIGGIAMVAMNNVPPNPANYLQRAGRAGRRRELRSVAMTLCKSNPHDQSVFHNSRWAFDAGLPAPHVALNSRTIVARHVNALLLGRFFQHTVQASGQPIHTLTSGWFFDPQACPAEQFADWCRDPKRLSDDPWLAHSLAMLLRGSVLEQTAGPEVAAGCADAIDRVRKGWQRQWQALAEQLQGCSRPHERDPAARAIVLQQRRLAGEYLLSDLASQGFLPGYGFPSDIVSFNTLTAGRLPASKDPPQPPTRDRMTALREYAPGSDVVINGLVHRSAGLTLNWHLPASDAAVREIQNLRFAWRCRQCGASGSSPTLEGAKACSACEAATREQDRRQILIPAGFAVDLHQEPHNDVTRQRYVPVESPWISGRGDWQPLVDPDCGRVRAAADGHVLHQSRGEFEQGYAICLACGRAEPMPAQGNAPKLLSEPHQRLRGSRRVDGICPGSHSDWLIKPGLTLAHEAITDVAELQLKTPDGLWLADTETARTLAVALRGGLARALGIQATELGCETKAARSPEGAAIRSMVLFDRYAAGYASSVPRLLAAMFQHAAQQLDCPAHCDAACPECVLEFDQRFAAAQLNRHKALSVLTPAWLDRLVHAG